MMPESEVSFEMRDRAFKICRDYLHGSWRLISSKDMVIRHISGGLSNVLYHCALPAQSAAKGHEPREVLVRFYGQVHGEEAMESILAESVIFTLLSERNLGPTLYGVFPGGRLEEYIPARSLFCQELRVGPISRQIASRMAQMHSLNVPISKEPTWMWTTMDRWLKSSEDFLSQTAAPSSSSNLETCSILQKLKSFPFRKEIDHIRRLTNKIQSPVVFAHNDMQEGNILLRNSSKSGLLVDRISLIDFEYCSYNYRGFDLANHFCEWVYSYALKKPPFFQVQREHFPSRDQQLNFIRAYLACFEAALGRKSVANEAFLNEKQDCDLSTISSNLRLTESSEMNGFEPQLGPITTNGEPSPLSAHPIEDVLLKEVKVFTLASHLFWGLWSIVQGHVSKIPFGYLNYALVRMEDYYEEKEKLQGEDLFKRKCDTISDQN